MADPKELANKARTTLSQALGALQSSPDVPEALMDVAEPIAKTMGILHRIERSGGGDPKATQEALDNVRGALDLLQSVGAQHPAVDDAMEAVAGSLSKLFALNKAIKAAAAAPAATPPAQSAPKPAQPKAASQKPAVQKPAVQKPAVQAEPAHAALVKTVVMADPDREPAAAPAPKPRELAPQPAPSPAFSAELAPQPAPRFEPAPAPQAAPQPAPQATVPQAAAPQPAAPQPTAPMTTHERVPGQSDAPLPPKGAGVVDVELGAHSGSNFYKGLAGNDVIDHGGIFVATYKVLDVGTAVALRVHLPGDLDFIGDAVVQWTRETQGGESEPGFGARFTRISQEGRQLVYRYVRNREPIFYDDF